MNDKNKKLLTKIRKEDKKIKPKTSALSRYKRKKIKERVVLVTIIVLVIATAAFMFSPYVKLKNINVTGENQISREEILKAGGVDTNLKTWTIRDKDIEKKIKDNYNIIKNVKVTSKMLNTINIEIEEYKLIAKYKKNDGTYDIILENGDTYNREIVNSYSLPLVEGFEDDKDKLSDVYKNLALLKEDVAREISEIINDQESNETITIYMRDGQKIKALSANFSEKLNYYNEMSQYIEDKTNTTLNLINGAYLETKKTVAEKESKIRALLGVPKTSSEIKDTDTNKDSSTKNTASSQANNKEQTTKSDSSSNKQTTTENQKKYTP